jgi:hypothetical protein
MAVPDTDLARIRRFCDEQTPPEFRDRMRLEVTTRGNSVTILNCEPLWGSPSAEWIKAPIAQLRYDHESAPWSLFWADRNDRWHPYDQLYPTRNVKRVVAEIEDDPTCIFFG